MVKNKKAVHSPIITDVTKLVNSILLSMDSNSGCLGPDGQCVYFVLLLLSHFSRVRLCATPQIAAHQALPPLGFSRQEHWSGLPFPSPMHEREKWKWSRSVVSDPQQPHGLQLSRLLHPWDFPGKSTGVGCHCLLQCILSTYLLLPIHTYNQ